MQAVPPKVPDRTYLALPEQPQAPTRKSSVPSQTPPVLRSQYSTVQEVINNPKDFTGTVVEQVVRKILITADATNEERAFAARQILAHKINYTDEETVAGCRFIIHNWKLFSTQELRYVIGKMNEFQNYYHTRIDQGLMREDAPHFNDKDLVMGAEVFIYINADFFSTTAEDVKQFLAFAGSEAPTVDEYRDTHFDLLRKLKVDEKAEELWKAKKYVKAPELSMEITLFLLKHMNHRIFTLWDSFVNSKRQTLPSSTNQHLY